MKTVAESHIEAELLRNSPLKGRKRIIGNTEAILILVVPYVLLLALNHI